MSGFRHALRDLTFRQTPFAFGLLVGIIACAGGVRGGELLFNGGFELGTAGFAQIRSLVPARNPELRFHPLAVDTAETYAGQRTLRLDNPHGDYFQILSQQFALAPDTEYRFSGAFRAATPGGYKLRLSVVRMKRDDTWKVHARVVELGDTWQQHGFDFRTDAEGGRFVLLLRYEGYPVPPATVWLDELSLRPKTSGVSADAEAEFSCALVPDRALYRWGETARVAVEWQNHTDTPVADTLRLTVRDQYFREWEEVVQIPLEAGPGAVVRREIELPLRRYGTFVLEAAVGARRVTVNAPAFAVVGEYVAGALDPVREACVGVNGGFDFRNALAPDGGYTAFNAPLDEKYRQLGMMGCRILREHYGSRKVTDWRLVEPESGVFDFSSMDRGLAWLARHHIDLMLCFGRFHGPLHPTAPPVWPAWLEPELTRQTNPPGIRKRYVVDFPPMARWDRYVEALARHAGSRVRLYEVMNEPNLVMRPEAYVPYLASARRAIRRANPEAWVVGIGATGDWDGELSKFVDGCVREGALKNCDAVGFHPYNARTLDSKTPADEQIRALRRLVGNTPLWNTELYYLFDHPGPSAPHETQADAPAHFVATRFLTDLGEGVTQSLPKDTHFLWQQPLHPDFFRQTELVPGGQFVAYNMLARHYEGAKPIGRFRPGGGVAGYAFRRRGGEPIAAFWNFRGRADARLDFSGFAATDFFGNPLPTGVRALDAAPIHLSPADPAESEDKFLERLRALVPELEQPISAATLLRAHAEPGADAGNLCVRVLLRNDSDEDLSLVVGLTGGGYVARKPIQMVLPARAARVVALPIQRIVGAAAGPPTLRLGYADRNAASPVALRENRLLADGEAFTVTTGEGGATAEGTASLSDAGLRLVLDVRDATDAGASGARRAWETDGVELFLDRDPFAVSADPRAYTDDTIRIFLRPRDAGATPEIWKRGAWPAPADIRYDLRVRPDGYRVELTLAFAPPEEGIVGFDLKLNDAISPTDKTPRSATLGGTTDLHKNRASFALLARRAMAAAASVSASAGEAVIARPVLVQAPWKAVPGSVGEYAISGVVARHPTLRHAFAASPDTFYRVEFEFREGSGQPLRYAVKGARRRDGRLETGPEWAKYALYFFSGPDTEVTVDLYFPPGDTVDAGTRNWRAVPLTEDGTNANTLPDGDFESGSTVPTAWRRSGAKADFPVRVVPDSGFFAGMRGLEVTLHPERETIFSSIHLPLVPGAARRLDFWAKSENPVRARAVVNVWNPYGHKGKHLYKSETFRLGPDWAACGTTLSVPATADEYPDIDDRLLEIKFILPPGRGRVWLDNISLTGRSDPDPPGSSPITRHGNQEQGKE